MLASDVNAVQIHMYCFRCGCQFTSPRLWKRFHHHYHGRQLIVLWSRKMSLITLILNHTASMIWKAFTFFLLTIACSYSDLLCIGFSSSCTLSSMINRTPSAPESLSLQRFWSYHPKSTEFVFSSIGKQFGWSRKKKSPNGFLMFLRAIFNHRAAVYGLSTYGDKKW